MILEIEGTREDQDVRAGRERERKYINEVVEGETEHQDRKILIQDGRI